MNTRLIATLACLCLPALALPAQAEPFKVGLIEPSPVADVGWAKQQDLGREAMLRECGPEVVAQLVENVPEGPDAARVLNQMISDGADFIVLGSFGYMNDGLRAAAKNPDVDFIHASGYKQLPNFGTFTSRNYEGFYLAAIAAAEVTKTNTIGIVAAFPVPEVIAQVDAIALALQKYRPEAEIKVIWMNTWFDPPKEQDAARALISQGADVIFSLHQDTPSVVNVAEAAGVYVVNTSSDMSKYGPNSVLASVTNDWSTYFVEQCKASREGRFEGVDTHGGLADGTVTVTAWNKALSEAQMAEIAKVEAGIKDGSYHIFAGPLKDQSGTLRVEEGAVLPDAELFGLNWLVEGLDGALPR